VSVGVAIRLSVAVIAFRALQPGNQSRFGQRPWRGEDNRVFVFVIPKFFEADRLCPFRCHAVMVVHLWSD